MAHKGRVQTVRDSFQVVRTDADAFARGFYDRLFAKRPEMRGLFADDMSAQQAKLVTTLVTAVNMFDTPSQLIKPLKQLGASHAQMGLSQADYQLVVDTIIETLETTLGSAWDVAHDRAWRGLLDFVSNVMQEGAADAA
ncbi:hypothetical protein ACMU_09600 [Actibacterium mucosum KCTC 23349]|uniref:Globin domain-containing protein n=1 Tax=Actibacterium mucosum KCTC 23349 TaxID=1454373 RepID=A0A037ZKD6_9RHOB|nr:globin domain-containing protein [Actibacterium mucosum]KAJ56007.1 hypothetical protein ACMU_09600 [Actibacterium mucosum KCTC 23349]